MIFIYALIDPRTCKIRYIGKTINLKQRFQTQLNEKSKTHRCNWIQGLRKLGLKPKQCILQTLEDNEDWEYAEIKWIAIAKKYGWNLVNGTSGGDGVKNLSEETRKRIATAWIGRKHKKESIEKMSKAQKGKIKSDEAKDKLSAIMKGREITWTDKLKIANRKFTDSDLLKIKEDLKTMMVKDVALKYNVHRTTISKIKNNQYETFKQKTINYKKPRRYDNL